MAEWKFEEAKARERERENNSGINNGSGEKKERNELDNCKLK